MSTLKRAPPPGRSVTSMRPPCARTMDWQIARPSPYPGIFECSAVCARTSGEKMRSRSSARMPGPWSSTDNSNSLSSVIRAETPSGVPGGEYLIAFCSRFASSRSIWLASIRTDGRLGGSSTRNGRSAMRPRTRWTAPRTMEDGLVNARSTAGVEFVLGARPESSESMSSASRSVSRSISAMNSLRVSSSHLTSVRRKLLTKPLMWLRGKRSSCAVAARTSSVEGEPDAWQLGVDVSTRRAESDR